MTITSDSDPSDGNSIFVLVSSRICHQLNVTRCDVINATNLSDVGTILADDKFMELFENRHFGAKVDRQ